MSEFENMKEIAILKQDLAKMQENTAKEIAKIQRDLQNILKILRENGLVNDFTLQSSPNLSQGAENDPRIKGGIPTRDRGGISQTPILQDPRFYSQQNSPSDRRNDEKYTSLLTRMLNDDSLLQGKSKGDGSATKGNPAESRGTAVGEGSEIETERGEIETESNQRLRKASAYEDLLNEQERLEFQALLQSHNNINHTNLKVWNITYNFMIKQHYKAYEIELYELNKDRFRDDDKLLEICKEILKYGELLEKLNLPIDESNQAILNSLKEAKLLESKKQEQEIANLANEQIAKLDTDIKYYEQNKAAKRLTSEAESRIPKQIIKETENLRKILFNLPPKYIQNSQALQNVKNFYENFNHLGKTR